MIVLLIIAGILAEHVTGQRVQGSADRRNVMRSEAKIFDLPKFAPTARIIKLSTVLRGKQPKKNEASLFRDAAGSFDNFDAFDLESIDAESSSGEAKVAPRRRQKSKSDEHIGEFFPESA
ncbi:hypothetical protein Q1695_013382 [Nippostrongylus brasiliensis]|nr:hypothetical protein Q1695_013382 [Nippostrongylus brasiliensis]